MAVVALSVIEQRYRAVMAVLDGARVSEVAAEVGVSRQSLHAWLRRYRAAGLAGLADRSHRTCRVRIGRRRSLRRWSASCGGRIRSGARCGSCMS